jgi:hypothetical protein
MSDFFSTQVTSQYRTAAITKAPIDTSNWTDINSTFATNTNKNNTSDDIFYAFSNDGRTTWKVISSAGERSIARNNSGTWQINNASAYDQESWSNVSDNTEFDALESAMTYSSNQLTSDELNALIDPNQITVADSLDLAIVFDTDSASFSASQYSQGVEINYSAAAINKGAIHGIDYEYDAPAQDEVRVTSLTGGNLKIRVI